MEVTGRRRRVARRLSTGLVLLSLLAVGCVSQKKYEQEVRRSDEFRRALQTQGSTLGAKIAELDRQVDRVRKALRERDAEIAQLREQLDTLTSRHQAALKRIEQLNEELERKPEAAGATSSQ